jgi:hypothetical protein
MCHQVLANFMQFDCDVSIIVYEYCLSHANDRGILLVVYGSPPCLGMYSTYFLCRSRRSYSRLVSPPVASDRAGESVSRT